MSWIGPKLRPPPPQGPNPGKYEPGYKPKRRKPIRPFSAKRRREIKARRAVVEAVLGRDEGCVARDVLEHECSGPLDVHELVRRSQWRGGYLVADNAICLCRVAHDWVGLHPHEAVELGLAKWSWQR